MSLLEVLKSVFAPFMDGEKPPLQIGEAFNLWFYLAGVEQSLRNSELQSIPPGAKLSDEELSNTIMFNELMGTQIAVRGFTESTRADVGAMFAKYLVMKSSWDLTMKQLMQKRGWLRIPPYLNR